MTEQSVLEFVSRSFRSVWPLELLHVLYQEPRTGWDIEGLARELRANVPVVTQGLSILEALRLVTADAEHRYRFVPREEQSWVYLLRVAAFVRIAVAIVRKNMRDAGMR